MPSCFLDEAFNLVYWNPAFNRLVESHWSLSARALSGRNLLTSLPLPAPLLLALACLPSDPKPGLVPRHPLGTLEEVWDTRIVPYVEEEKMLGVLVMFQDRSTEVKRDHDDQPRLQLLQALLATTEEAVCWVMANGTIRLENEPASLLFGAPRTHAPYAMAELLAGMGVLRPDGTPLGEDLNPFAMALAGRSLPATAFLVRRANGPDLRCHIAVTPVMAGSGTPVAALVTVRDLGAAPSAGPRAADPAASDPFVDSLLESIPAVLYFLDPQLRLQRANPFMLRRLGVEVHQVVGKPIDQVLSLPPEQIDELREAMQSASYVHRPYVAYHDRASGRRTYWDNYLTPVRDRDGRLQGLVVMSNEVTWRVELTQALADKVHQLAAIVGHIADGVLVATPQGELLLVNEAAQRMLNLPPQSNVAYLECFDIRDMNNVPIPISEMPITQVLSGQRVGETFIRVKDDLGQDVVLTTSGTPILGEGQEVLMGVIVFHDVTEEFRLREALTDKVHALEQAVTSLRELDKLKTDFLNTISHELRTPLTNIIGYVELIEDQVVGPLNAPQQDAAGQVMMSARHLLTLINDLLDFTQLEAGKIAFSFVPVQLSGMVDQVLPAVRTKSGKELETTVSAPSSLPRVRADYNRVMQVLENLLDNAFKFTPEGGHVTITLAPEGPDFVRVDIQDSGIGIPADALPKLFSKFYQVESGLRRERGGTGLGLAICKMLIERQGGHIGLESEEGRGTHVWFTMPVWHEATAPADVELVG
jgi:PAS domain S-box-containing protein